MSAPTCCTAAVSLCTATEEEGRIIYFHKINLEPFANVTHLLVLIIVAASNYKNEETSISKNARLFFK